jgi:hypothetical protein
MKDTKPLKRAPLSTDLRLSKLTVEQVKQIDEMLEDVGDYGEVHIIVQRGELRYINKVESYRFVDEEEGD